MSSPGPSVRKRKSRKGKQDKPTHIKLFPNGKPTHIDLSPEALGALSPGGTPLRDLTGKDDLNNLDTLNLEESDELALVPVRSISRLAKQKLRPQKTNGYKRRTGFIFFLGGLFGIIIAGFFAQKNDLIDLAGFGDLTEMAGLGDLGLDRLMDVLPAGFLQDAKELKNSERAALSTDSFSVGINAANAGLKAHHSVVMIPGVISTGLESWGTDTSSRPYFRKRLWGSWTMMRALVGDKEEWKRHIMLDKKTGLDPPGIKVRAAQGFDATDFFITGYWIWSKVLENLAGIGYDPTNSFTAAYDWRLSYANLETRDHYFTRLKGHIELAVKLQGKKIVLISHSMGSEVMLYFFHWAASPLGGSGGDSWVDTHIDSWINISGSLLGALKGMPAVLSGEMKDTAQLNAFAVYGLERFLSREERAEIFRAMPGISSMLPKGGDAVWGNLTWAPDDHGQEVSYGTFLNFKDENVTHPAKNLTVSKSLEFLWNNTETWYQDAVRGSYSHGVAHTKKEVEANELDPRKWINPLETRLPLAPNLKIFCFYGTGKPTERGYFYRDTSSLVGLNVTIDTSINAPDGSVNSGIVLSEGDGTVNLLSLGYMCNKGWKMKRYNPAGVKIITREMKHEPDRFNPRGGPKTGDHVDILGRTSLNELILKIAAGGGDDVTDEVESRIMEYSDNVEVYDDDEAPESRRKAIEKRNEERRSKIKEMKPEEVVTEEVVVEVCEGKQNLSRV